MAETGLDLILVLVTPIWRHFVLFSSYLLICLSSLLTLGDKIGWIQLNFNCFIQFWQVTLDQQLTFAPHINRLCSDCYYQLRQLRVISRSLTSTATATLVHAFV